MSHDTPPDDPGTDAGAQSDDDRGLPKVTRRMALGLLGLGVLAGGETTAVQGDVGGGPDSDELAHVLRPTYEGPESELPAPGVEGRRFTVTDTGGTYPQWSELRDTGSAWEPINFGAGSVNTESLHTEGTPWYDVTTFGAVGDGSTDDRAAIQSAINAAESDGGGVVFFPDIVDSGRTQYAVGTSGNRVTDALEENYTGDIEYALEGKSNVTLRGESRDTVEIITPDPEVVPLWSDDQTNVTVESLTWEGNYHTAPQPNDYYPNGVIQVLMFGGTDKPSTGSTDITVRDCVISGGIRHGIDVQYGTRVRIDNVLFDDAAGDDCCSISTGTEYVTLENCYSINRARSGGWNPSSFELEDGVKYAAMESCFSIGIDAEGNGSGFSFGKSHTDKPPTQINYLKNIHAINPATQGIVLQPVLSPDSYGALLDGFSVVGAGAAGIFFAPSTAVDDHTIVNGNIRDCDGHGIRGAGTATTENFTIDNVTIRNCGKIDNDPGVELQPNFEAATLRGVNIIDCYEGCRIKGRESTLDDVRVRDCQDVKGIYLSSDADHSSVDDCLAKNNGTNGAAAIGIQVAGDDCTVTSSQAFDDAAGSGDQTWSVWIAGDNCSVSDCVIGPSATGRANNVGSDNRWHDNHIASGEEIKRNGTRILVNGMGRNSGDPSSTGQWNGNGVEGVVVRDTANANTYVYNNGSWSQIASA